MNDKIQQNLIIGTDADKNIVLSEKSRLYNLAYIGTKNSGKTTKIIPTLAKQQISNGGNFVGCTFVVNDKEEAYFLMSLTQRLKRKTQLKVIKPSADIKTYKMLIEDKPYNFDAMNNLINYKQEIRNKSIVIIDLEEELYGEKSRRLLRKLLHHLYLSAQDIDATLKRPHYLYIDDADSYIEDIENILKYGENYDISTTLFLNSISKLNNSSKYLLESCVKNYVVLSNLILEDTNYFAEKFLIKAYKDGDSIEKLKTQLLKDITLRTPNTIYYDFVDEKGIKKFGKCALYLELKDVDDRDSISAIAKKIKKKMLIPNNNVPFKMAIEEFNKKNYNSINEKIIEEKQKPIKIKENKIEKTSENIITDAILENINSIPDLYQGENSSFDIENLVELNKPIKESNETLEEIIINNSENLTEDIPKKKKKKKKKKKNKQNQENLVNQTLEINENEIIEDVIITEENNDEEVLQEDTFEEEKDNDNNIEKEEYVNNDTIVEEENFNDEDEIENDIEEDDDEDISSVISELNQEIIPNKSLLEDTVYNNEDEVIIEDEDTEAEEINELNGFISEEKEENIIFEETDIENNDELTDSEDMMITIDKKEIDTRSEIEQAFDNSYEKMADIIIDEDDEDFYIPRYAEDFIDESIIAENINNNELESNEVKVNNEEDKTYFDFDSLFDDEEE